MKKFILLFEIDAYIEKLKKMTFIYIAHILLLLYYIYPFDMLQIEQKTLIFVINRQKFQLILIV